MTKRRPLYALALSLALTGTAVGTLAPVESAYAAQRVSTAVGPALQEAQNLIKAGDLNGAIAKCKQAQTIAGRTAYDDYVINQLLGYLYVQKKDYRSAIPVLEAQLKNAPAGEKGKLIKTIAQLAYAVRDYGKTITYANRYLKEVGPDSSLQMLVATSYYQTRDFRSAMATTQAVIASAQAGGRSPPKDALTMQLACAYQLGEKATIKSTYFQLVGLYPSSAYWTNLFKFIEGGGMSDSTTYNERYLKFKLGLLTTGEDYFNLGKLAFALGYTGDAKAILDEGFKKKILGAAANQRDQRLQTVVNAAAAKALAELPAADTAAAAGKLGDADVKVGLAYAGFGQTDKAVAAIKRGIAKGNVTKPDEAYLSLARVYLVANRDAEARQAAANVKSDGSTKDVARCYAIATGQI